MKQRTPAFTVIELLIVVSIITVLTGVGSKMWYTMERISKASNRNLTFITKNQIIMDRLARDIRCSISAKKPEDALLALSQISIKGEEREVLYSVEAGELIRVEKRGDNQQKSLKITSLTDEHLDISVLPDGTVRLEVSRERRDRPLEVQSRRLISFVRPCGGIR